VQHRAIAHATLAQCRVVKSWFIFNGVQTRAQFLDQSAIFMLKPIAQMVCHPNNQGVSPKHLSPNWFVTQMSGDHTFTYTILLLGYKIYSTY